MLQYTATISTICNHLVQTGLELDVPYQIRHTGMRTNTYRYCCHGKSGNSKWSAIFEKPTRAQHGHKFSFQLEFGDIGANSWSPSQTWKTKLSTHSNADLRREWTKASLLAFVSSLPTPAEARTRFHPGVNSYSWPLLFFPGTKT